MIEKESIHRGDKAKGKVEVAADNERFNGRVSAAFGLRNGHFGEETSHLAVQETHISASEYLGEEGASGAEGVGGDVEGGEEELRLHVLVDVVETSHIRSAVTHHKIGEISLKVTDNQLCG